jgi:hypothetical protein
LGAKNITKQGTTALIAGDIASGRVHLIEYDGTRFQLLNPASSTGTGAEVFATSPTLVTPALGTPSALVGTNITGTAANFNINGTVGATTPTTGAFTTVTATGEVLSTGSGAALAIARRDTSAKKWLVYSASGEFNIYNNAGGAIPLTIADAAANNTVAITSAGLAVTGAISATTTGKVGTTLGVGNATPSTSGAGITFPATQSASTDANTLDDYEEGTWTPVDGSGASLSFTGVLGTYTKVGRLVTALAELTYPTTASGVNAIIGGLPFTAAGAGINGYIRYTSVATSLLTFVSGGAGSASVSLLRPGVNTTNASMSAGTLLFAVIYYV